MKSTRKGPGTRLALFPRTRVFGWDEAWLRVSILNFPVRRGMTMKTMFTKRYEFIEFYLLLLTTRQYVLNKIFVEPECLAYNNMMFKLGLYLISVFILNCTLDNAYVRVILCVCVLFLIG